MSIEQGPRRQGPLSNLANQLTTVRLFLSLALFVAIALESWIVCLILFAVAAVTDWLDGYFARRQGLVTSLGRAYDPLADKVLVSGAFIFLLEVPGAGLRAWMVAVIVAREFVVTGIRGFLEEMGVSFGADRWGKLKMGLQCAALIWIFASLGGILGNPSTDWIKMIRDILNLSATVVTVLSGLNYLRKAWPHLV